MMLIRSLAKKGRAGRRCRRLATKTVSNEDGASAETRKIDEEDKYIEWEQRVDKKTKRTFYLHPDTKQTTWHHPSVGLRPATLSRRMAAGTIDLFASAGFGTALGMLYAWELDGAQYGQMAVAAGFLISFTCRDSIFQRGTRSLGKRVMALEVVRRSDGMLPTRMRTLGRNFYAPIFGDQFTFFPFVHLIFFSDIFMMKYDRQCRRFGDFLCDTTVVPEMPMMKERVNEQAEQHRLAQMREESGNEWIWKVGKLTVVDRDASSSTKAESSSATSAQMDFFQPPMMYGFNWTFLRINPIAWVRSKFSSRENAKERR